MLFLPRFDQFGNLSTLIIEDDSQYYVDMEPKALMNHCLGYYGSSLRGASDGAKKILGNIQMCPVLMSEKLEIYWFSTRSPEHEDCIWFALHHIKDYESKGLKETKVIFNNGTEITIDISLYRFINKIQRAYQLKGKLEERSKLYLITKELQLPYQIRRPIGLFNYEIERDEQN